MTDLLSSGPDTPGRRGTKVIVVCLCLLAIAAFVIEHAGGSSHSRRPLASVTSRTPAPSVTTGTPSPTRTHAPAAAQADVHAVLQGLAGTAPRGVVLLVGGTKPTTVGGRADQFAQVPLGKGDGVSAILPAKGGFVVAVTHPLQAQGRPDADIYWVHTDGRATHITGADDLVLARTGDRIFAMRYGSTDSHATDAQRHGTVTELTLDGHVVVQHKVAAALRLVADTSRGLLITTYGLGTPAEQLQLLDPATMAIRLRIIPVGAVLRNGDWVGWTPPFCTELCALTVVNVRNVQLEVTVPISPDFFIAAFAMSRDGRKLAVSYFGRHPEGKLDAAPGYVEVTTVATGQVVRIPGVRTAEKQAADLAWTPDGRSLAIGVGLTDQDERGIGLWPANGGRLRVLPGRYPGGYPPSALVAS